MLKSKNNFTATIQKKIKCRIRKTYFLLSYIQYHRIPHHPKVVTVNKNISDWFILMLAVYAFHSGYIRSGRFRTSTEPTLHFSFIKIIHLSTTQLQGNTHFHSASYMHSVFPQAFFNAPPMVFFYFLRRVYPIRINRLKAELKVITPNRCDV
jgi:hypothetical protein